MAELDRVPEALREQFMQGLMEEAADMSSKELAFLLLDAMDDSEVIVRVRELETGRIEPDASFH